MTNFFSLNDLGLSQSTDQLLQTWLTEMQSNFPGYAPSAANLEYVQAQIFASFAADLATLCSNGATELFRTFATTLVGIPFQQGVSAQAVINITAQTSPTIIATTSADITIAGGSIVSLPVIALPYGIAAGTITITDPTLANTQNWTTPGANAGDTSIPVSIQTPNFDYVAGSTISGTQSYEVPALTEFELDALGFTNLESATIDAGTSQQVTVTAVQSGVVFNGAGSGGDVQSIQQLPWVGSITLVSAASGGADPEDDTHYLNRVTTALQLQAPRPITAADYATMALNFNPYPGTDQQEVGRATSIDGYNPADGSFNNQRMVAVAVTDENGFALNNDTLYGYPNGSSLNIVSTTPSPVAGWGIAGWLQSLREINFIVNVINPTYTPVYVTVSVKAASGYDVMSVQLNVQASVLAYLAPSAWGLPPVSAIGWDNTTTIYQSKLLNVIQNTAGVDHVIAGTLKFGFSPTPSNTTDIALPGAIALPTSTTSTVPTSGITVT